MLVTLVGAFPRSINILQTQSSDNDHLDRKARQPALANDGKAGSPLSYSCPIKSLNSGARLPSASKASN